MYKRQDEEIREAKEAFLNYLEGEVDKITVAEVVIDEEMCIRDR